jgi:hypothetical protein
LSRMAAARSLKRAPPGRDASPFVRAALRDARAAVRAAPPDALAGAPCLRSAPVAARQLLQEAAVAGGGIGAGAGGGGLWHAATSANVRYIGRDMYRLSTMVPV